jgi:hypothetical protein
MNSNSVMFILLIIFVIVTVVAIGMCFMKNNTSSPKELSEEEELVDHVTNMNRTYNRFYWGNNELD